MPRNATSAVHAAALGLALASLGAVAARADEAPARPQSGVASYYRPEPGETTASGAPADPHSMTAASPTLPLGTKAKVTNTRTGKSVKVTVTDRGPYVKHRILDVTPKVARKLGMKKRGVAHVKVKPLRTPRPEDHDKK